MDKGKVVLKQIKCTDNKPRVYFLGYDEDKHKDCCLLNYAKKVFKDNDIEKISLKDTLTSFKEKDGLVEEIKHNDVILLCGCKENVDRQLLTYQVLKGFRNNNIIVFADTLDLDIKDDYREIIKNHTNLHLFVKEDEVLQQLKKDFPETKIYKKPTEKQDSNIIKILRDAKANKKWFKTVKNPKISICVPVYNVEKYLPMCIDSFINQTYKNIEIILVNDVSPDNCGTILKEYAKKDDRIKIINHEKNQGPLCARIHAVKMATGDYIMFADSDDTIAPNACKILANAIENYGTDIISYDTNVVNFGKNNEAEYNWQKSWFTTHLSDKQRLFDEEISIKSLKENKFSFNVWNKIARAEVCKKTYAMMPEERYLWAEDMLIQQHLYYFAKDFIHIKDKLYNYSFGIGISTTKLTHEKYINNFFFDIKFLTDFQNFAKEDETIRAGYIKASEFRKQIMLNEILYRVVDCVSKEKRVVYLNKLIETVGLDTVVEVMIKRYYDQTEKVATVLNELNINAPKKDKIKNIGIFYHRIGNGGVERVIQKITPLLLDSGYNVTLFIEEKRDDDYPIDKRAKIELVPKYELDEDNYFSKKRFEIFREKIKEYNIDTIMYQSSSFNLMLYDLMLFRSLGVYVLTTAHELFCQEMCNSIPTINQRLKILKNTDLIQTLSKTEEVFWTNLGVNAKYIPNPLTFDPKENKIAKKKEKLIVWVGRFAPYQKKPKDAIDIFEQVYEADKDARMIMLGKGENEAGTNDILNYIKSKKLDGVIENIYDNDIKKYYEKASLLLVTSTYETFSLVLSEAMSFGLPCVTYDMPYLELLQNNEGVLTVEQRDINSAAQEIIELLNNQEKLDNMGKKAKQFIEKFAENKPLDSWKKVLAELPNKKQTKQDLGYNKIIEETIFEHYTVGTKEIFNNYVFKNENTKLTFFARAKRCLKVNGVWGTFKKVVKKTFRKIKRILFKK